MRATKFLLLLLCVTLALVSCGGRGLRQNRFAKAVKMHSVYLPIISNIENYKFGVEYESPVSKYEQFYNPASAIRMSFRQYEYNDALGRYDFEYVDRKTSSFRITILTGKMVAAYARAPGAAECELPHQANWPLLFEAWRRLIEHVGPDYFEIWNEPDAQKQHMPPEHYPFYGCIGDGELYGNFARAFYNYVAPYKGKTKIVIGAVSNPYGEFLPQALEAAAGKHDAVSFHCYEHSYDGNIIGWCPDAIDHVKTLTDKEVIISETGVLYKAGTLEEYHGSQIEHFCNLVKHGTLFIWYTGGYNGWPPPYSTDLLRRDPGSGNLTPRPVHAYYMSLPEILLCTFEE